MKHSEKKNLVLLCDFGLDDAAAAVYLLEHRHRFGCIDIVTIAGNSAASASYDNALKLLTAYEGDLAGVRLIHSADFPQAHANLPSVHGQDGMGDLLRDITPRVPVLPYKAFLRSAPADFTLVSLGPATVALDILKQLNPKELLIMGGHIDAEPNHRGYEFNHYLDIPAFNEMTGYPHVCATLDTCRTPHFNYAKKVYAGETLLDLLIKRAIELAVARHPDNCYIYDYIAVHYLTFPEKFTVETKTDLEGNTIHQLLWIGDRPSGKL